MKSGIISYSYLNWIVENIEKAFHSLKYLMFDIYYKNKSLTSKLVFRKYTQEIKKIILKVQASKAKKKL